MNNMSWYEKWKAAYERATFYKSEQNTSRYWDAVSLSQSDGFAGTKHIELLKNYLLEEKIIDKSKTILDAGCGLGNYTLHLADHCKHIIAMDFSEHMLTECKRKCQENGIFNVTYKLGNIVTDEIKESYDCVLACLNPATYHPEIFDKLLKITSGCVVYFSMDIPVDINVVEPIYCGTNSVRYVEEYLQEQGLAYTKIPFTYTLEREDGTNAIIPFAYIVAYKRTM